MQTHPSTELRQLLYQLLHVGFDRTTVDKTGAKFDIHTIRAGVLRHDEQLFYTRLNEFLGFTHHIANRPRNQIATQRWDDAKRAAMVATFGNFQIRIVARRELDALRWNQINKRIMRFRQMNVHGIEHFIGRVRPRYCQNFRMHSLHQIFAVLILTRAQTTGHHDFAVLMQRFTDRIKRLLYRAVDKTTGVDHNQIGILI